MRVSVIEVGLKRQSSQELKANRGKTNLAHIFTVKSNANRKVRATIEQYPDLKAEDFTVEPVAGGFVVRMTVRNAADQEVALNRGFEYAVPGIEPAPEAAAQVPSIDDYKAAADNAPPARTADDEAVLAAGDHYYGRDAIKPVSAPEPEWFETRGQAQAAAFARGLGALTVRKTDDEAYGIVVDADPQSFRRPQGAQVPRARRPEEGARTQGAQIPRTRGPGRPRAEGPACRAGQVRGDPRGRRARRAAAGAGFLGRSAQAESRPAGAIRGAGGLPDQAELHQPEGDGPLPQPLSDRPQGARGGGLNRGRASVPASLWREAPSLAQLPFCRTDS